MIGEQVVVCFHYIMLLCGQKGPNGSPDLKNSSGLCQLLASLPDLCYDSTEGGF
jgi:hypothetical protein